MSLPFDLEDVVGVAFAELIKKVLLLVAALVWGSFQAYFAIMAVSLVADLVGGILALSDLREYLAFFFVGGFFGWLGPIFSMWSLVYLVCLLGLLFYLFKSEGSLWRPFVAGIVIVGVFILLQMEIYEDWWGILIFFVWAGTLGAVLFFAKIQGNLARLRAERHFREIAIENERKKAEREEEERLKYSD